MRPRFSSPMFTHSFVMGARASIEFGFPPHMCIELPFAAPVPYCFLSVFCLHLVHTLALSGPEKVSMTKDRKGASKACSKH